MFPAVSVIEERRCNLVSTWHLALGMKSFLVLEHDQLIRQREREHIPRNVLHLHCFGVPILPLSPQQLAVIPDRERMAWIRLQHAAHREVEIQPTHSYARVSV